ncbi:monovalent cation/H+ antiporter complex subunit F [Spongiibacter sp.]|uniref:monovalent cation/H+ antiporter complex subunit F n=1 Tax=Spongiibacter sp. TaxID=2024860 RepID=UPI003563098B
MLIVTTMTLLLVMAMALSRAFVGPTVFDRILAANMFGTKTVLLIAVIGFLFGRPEFLDIAIVYALINFIGVIGMLRLIEYLEAEKAGAAEDEQ